MLQADFINVVAWSKIGEFCSKYFEKGQQVGIIGRIQNRSWDDDQGQKHYITEIIAEEAYFADSKKDNSTQVDNNLSDFGISSDDDLPF